MPTYIVAAAEGRLDAHLMHAIMERFARDERPANVSQEQVPACVAANSSMRYAVTGERELRGCLCLSLTQMDHTFL